MDFLSKLFSGSDFMPRLSCGGGWTPALIYLHLIGDAMISFSYTCIPIFLLIVHRARVKNKLDLEGWAKYANINIVMFVLFILFCGGTHENNIIVFWIPAYRWFGVWTFVTGLISIASLYVLAWSFAMSYHTRRDK